MGMKYLKHINEATFSRILSQDEVKALYTPLINWNLINDAKDMALEYLDEGMILNIRVIDTANKHMGYKSHRSSYIYGSNFSHDKYEEVWYRVENGNIRLKYSFFIERLNRAGNPIQLATESNELISRLKEAYPNENI